MSLGESSTNKEVFDVLDDVNVVVLVLEKSVIIIEDGAKWVQIDTNAVRTPKSGMPIRIRRATMGSYFANIAGRPAIRMRREN